MIQNAPLSCAGCLGNPNFLEKGAAFCYGPFCLNSMNLNLAHKIECNGKENRIEWDPMKWKESSTIKKGVGFEMTAPHAWPKERNG